MSSRISILVACQVHAFVEHSCSSADQFAHSGSKPADPHHVSRNDISHLMGNNIIIFVTLEEHTDQSGKFLTSFGLLLRTLVRKVLPILIPQTGMFAQTNFTTVFCQLYNSIMAILFTNVRTDIKLVCCKPVPAVH